MEVFSEEPQILLDLIENFPGTNRLCYDAHGKAKKIILQRQNDNE